MPKASSSNSLLKKSAKKDKSTKKRKPREEEDDDSQVGDIPDVDSDAEKHAVARSKKKQKKKAAEPEPDSEPESEPEDEGNAEEKARKKLRRSRENKKVSGYRSKAKEAGYVANAGVVAASGIDSLASALTIADAKRLMRFCPENLGKGSFDKSECLERMALSIESVPASAARETQARCESVLRWIFNQAVLRTVEKGAQRVDAATMNSVLRAYQHNTMFTSVAPPKGVVRHAQNEGKLKSTTADEENADADKTENKELQAQAKKLDAAEAARKEAFAARKKELADAREKAAPAVKAK